MPNSSVKLTIAFIDENLDDEEKSEEVEKLLTQIRELDEVEEVSRVTDPNPPANNKSVIAFLSHLLMAEVKLENFKKLFGFLSERLGNKPVKLTVKAPDGSEINVEASSQKQFEIAWQKAQNFLDKKQNNGENSTTDWGE
ncbi:hypothetical protein [Nostoc sp. FACHB-145]|uniref:hypothetical protein n=1 Tax=Nostoc sp. FACHB-145 TaxID=2692836 RepID=UPI0016886267|nr:hypothetical protein [Nostoc sp. FACHB-145]MBD2472244.1 hypothetical protein [Nostoc sp. FACHB-145]